VIEVFRKALEAIVALETVTVSKKIKAIANISHYLYIKKMLLLLLLLLLLYLTPIS
jgi:hypothetical protein